MKVVSTNIGEKREVIWKGKKVLTGIYKFPIEGSLSLGKTDVVGDSVIDRKYHGGEDKAFYAFSADHYNYWKSVYPHLDWSYGMFGENLTVENFREENIFIGNIYRLGSALVQVSEPRQPCFKLGIRFGNQNVLKKFIAYGYCGVYFRVLENGKVKTGDKFLLEKEDNKKLNIKNIFEMLYNKNVDKSKIKDALNHPLLAESTKNNLLRNF